MTIEERSLPWIEILEAAFRRRRLILGFGAVGLVVGGLLAMNAPRQYEAEARILLTAQAISGPRADAMTNRQINAELALLRSPALILSVLRNRPEKAEAEDLGTVPEGWRSLFAGLFGRTGASSEAGGAPNLQRQAALYAQRIKAEPLQGSNVVRISYVDREPEAAAAFVNSLLTHHVERIASLGEQSIARSFYNTQSQILEERWREAREALAVFRELHGSNLLSGDEEQLRTLILRLETDRVTAETELLEKRARVDFISEEIVLHPKTIAAESRVTENESLRALKIRIVELEIERSDLLSRYTPTSTLVRERDRQIEQARELLTTVEASTLSETMTAPNPAYQSLEVNLVEAKADLSAEIARLTALNSQVTDYREFLSVLELSATELEKLENDVEVSDEAYQTYLGRAEEARFSSALDESGIVNVSIVEEATVPVAPQASKSGRTIGVFLVLGLFVGALLAGRVEWIDPTVRSSSQIRRLSRIPVLAEISS